MNKKWIKIIFSVSVILNAAVILTFGYLWGSEHIQKPAVEQEKQAAHSKDFWIVSVKLDIPELDPQAVQLAFFEYDPIPDFRERARGYYQHFNRMQERAKTDDDKKTYCRIGLEDNWNKAFMDIRGDQLIMITGGCGKSANAPSGKLWVVTKVAYLNDEPICWCIPVQPEIGEVSTVYLNKSTAFDVSGEFDRALAEGSKEPKTRYPSDPNFKDEVGAHGLYNKMIDIFRSAKSVYYEAIRWFGSEGMLNKTNYRVWLKKPNYARMEAAVNGNITGTLVGDGEFFWMYWGDVGTTFKGKDFTAFSNTTYMQVPSPRGQHSLAHMGTKLNPHLSMLTFQPSIFHGSTTGFDEYLDGVRSMGTEVVNGEQCSVIEVSIMKNQRSQYYWISKNDYLPRKIREVVRGDQVVIAEEIWSNVFMNMEISDAMFSWKPPSGWTQYFEPDWQDDLLKSGTSAPDFEFKSTEGKIIKLSDFKGNVVLLNFWRVGCPPCREELPYLESFHQRFRDKGLIVIGFNPSDDYQIALDLLKENAITYSNIIDASQPAQDIYFKQYQTISGRAAVPMNYLIDREGKVVEAWYGYDEDEKPLLKKLKELGIK